MESKNELKYAKSRAAEKPWQLQIKFKVPMENPIQELSDSQELTDIQKLHKKFMSEERYVRCLREPTLRGYEQAFKLLNTIYPNLELSMITTDIMVNFFVKLQTRERIVGKGKVKVGIKDTTVAMYRSKLNVFFDWLIERGRLKFNPFDKMEYPSVEYFEKKRLSRKEIDKILSAITIGAYYKNNFVRKRDLALISVAQHCGLRKGEILNLKLHDIDLEKNRLLVQGSTSKSKRNRIVLINWKLKAMLKDYLQERRRKEYRTPYVFVSNNTDRGLSYDGFKHMIEKIKKASGVNFHIHQFRHTFALTVLKGRTDVSRLKTLLGHKDIRMTDTYLRDLPPDDMKEDVDYLADLDNYH